MAHEHCDDLEQLQRGFAGWDAELIQLGRIHGAAWSSMTLLPSTRIFRVHAGRSVVIRGQLSAGVGYVALASSHYTHVRLLGQPLDTSCFAIMGRGARIDVFLPADATLCIIGAASLADFAPRRVQIRTSTPESVAHLLHCATSTADAALSDRTRTRLAIDDVLNRQIRLAIESSVAQTPGARTRSLRTSAALRACRFIEAHLGQSISLADLCKHCGAGVRTLEYGFRQLYDTTPISFIKSQRLSRARDALLRMSGQPVVIQQVATRLGFTHMGQFAQDYRLHFDESPSTTLQRARQRRQADRTMRQQGDVAGPFNQRPLSTHTLSWSLRRE
ncbi:helix-turn-helix domain-containing protein [Povalibacter sp.]|uniref:AraC family transcriptional regulator n=1 Tax=Povalibacter sp. TaxID=1962978 RepID=UPI002F4110A2